MPAAARELSPDLLKTEITEMLEALTHPAYVAAMKEVRDTPIDKRLARGALLLTPRSLREKGVPLPEKMRISSRYFEEGLPDYVEYGDLKDGGANVITGLAAAQPDLLDRLRIENPALLKQLLSSGPGIMAGCCCGGAATACGGCGGAT
ncbi:hypothetical protein [Rhizobium sp. MHM7A]|uniref:hypothetical protein n=1 Tax=Rhizobium sp. MHM7A TaxID=2583233 RepID=UPI001105D35C|nr:hypothetical protein [Rhizobium sp. MHM7A]TLX05681.1 hypothetical protein FFR93_33895 [Rhizobium sp. MHM7A]